MLLSAETPCPELALRYIDKKLVVEAFPYPYGREFVHRECALVIVFTLESGRTTNTLPMRVMPAERERKRKKKITSLGRPDTLWGDIH
jgi:hypothetical protein